MDYLHSLKTIANSLDREGFYKQADRIDAYLRRVAQAPQDPLTSPDASVPENPAPTPPTQTVTPSLPTSIPLANNQPTKEETEAKMARTTLMMFQKLRDVYAEYLPKMDYLGTDNVKSIQAAFDQFISIFQAVLRNKGQDSNNSVLQDYEGHIKNIENELKRSSQMRLTPVKVKVDKFILYEELSTLIDKLERLYNGGMKDLNPVVRKARSLRNTFANTIQSVSEQIAHADLIEQT